MSTRVLISHGWNSRVGRIILGVYGRYLLREHLRHCSIVAAGLLSLSLTIDLIPQLPQLLSPAASGGGEFSQVVLLVAYRAADLFPRFLPLSAFLGVLWTEISLSSSRERLLFWNSGRSPVHGLAPVLAIAVILGFVQFSFDNWLRPAAMWGQIERHLGSLGQQYDRQISHNVAWFSAGPDLVRARVQYNPVALYEVMLFQFDASRHLTEVDTAETALPGQNRDRWRFFDGKSLLIGSLSGASTTDGVVPVPPQSPHKEQFKERNFALALDPVWVAVWGIGPEYLSRGTLTALTSLNHDPQTNALFGTRTQLNWSNAVMPGAMAALASVLAIFSFPYRATLSHVFGACLGGYAAHLALRIAVVFGEHGYLSPVLAAWLVPGTICAVVGMLLVGQTARRRARIGVRRQGL